MNNPRGYTDTELEAIEGFLKEYLSATVIAARLTAMRGCRVTRNAIIGIVHRNKTLRAIGLKGRAPRQKRSKIPGVLAAPKVKQQPKKPASEAPRPVVRRITLAPEPRVSKASVALAPRQRKPVPLLKLKPGQCKFPVEASKVVGGHLFCAKPATEGSYCSQHHQICHGVGTFPERAAARVLSKAAA